MRNVSLYNRLNSLCRCVALPNCCLYPLKEKSNKEWEALTVLFITLALIRLLWFVSTFESGGRCKNPAMKESEHHVFPSQAEGKRQAGLREGEEPQRGPSEEGGGLFRPQREAG